MQFILSMNTSVWPKIIKLFSMIARLHISTAIQIIAIPTLPGPQSSKTKLKCRVPPGRKAGICNLWQILGPKKDAKWLYRYKTRDIIEQVFPLKHKQSISLQAPPVRFLSDSTSISPPVKQAIYLNKYCPDCKTRHGRGESSKINRFYAK